VFAVSESAIMGLKTGQVMQATVLSTGQSVQGKVRELAAMADPVTRTYLVKLALDAGAHLPLGASLNVRTAGLPGSAAKAMVLPTSALRQDAQGTAVWVLDEATMTVNSQVVQLGPVIGNDVAVVSGLTPGQKVVSAGVHVLSPGQKVTVYGAVPSMAPAATTAPAR
jgi:RND family efflux transporter MFP subunit